MRDGIEALPSREVGSGTVGRVAARGRTPYPLSRLKLVRRGTQSAGYTVFPKIDEQDKVMCLFKPVNYRTEVNHSNHVALQQNHPLQKIYESIAFTVCV
jgi:hypothetical protein